MNCNLVRARLTQFDFYTPEQPTVNAVTVLKLVVFLLTVTHFLFVLFENVNNCM